MQTGDRAALHTTKHSSGIDVSDEALASAYKDVQDSDSKTNWCLATYKAGSKSEIVLESQGGGGFADMVAHLPDDGVRFGACSYTAGGRERVFFISWIGEDVGAMARARAGMHKQGVLNSFEGVVGDVHATSKDEIAADAVVEALSKSGAGAVALP